MDMSGGLGGKGTDSDLHSLSFSGTGVAYPHRESEPGQRTQTQAGLHSY